jgi:hypothetical protein
MKPLYCSQSLSFLRHSVTETFCNTDIVFQGTLCYEEIVLREASSFRRDSVT